MWTCLNTFSTNKNEKHNYNYNTALLWFFYKQKEKKIKQYNFVKLNTNQMHFPGNSIWVSLNRISNTLSVNKLSQLY